MRLRDKDKSFLQEIGYSAYEFQQIEYAMRAGKTRYYEDDVLISREEAIRILGRERYISGVARSAFHGSSLRFSETQEQSVYFDSSRMFQ